MTTNASVSPTLHEGLEYTTTFEPTKNIEHHVNHLLSQKWARLQEGRLPSMGAEYTVGYLLAYAHQNLAGQEIEPELNKK